MAMTRTKAMNIRTELGHPVIDGDGHVLELRAVFADFCRDHGAGAIVDGVPPLSGKTEWMNPDLPPEEKRRLGLLPVSWHAAAETEYFADVTLPSRYYERLDEAGIDFSVLYPTMGLMIHSLPVDEQRITLSRLYNEFMAEQYRPYRDRFTMAAIIPAHTPDEAIAGLEHAQGLGAKVCLMPSHIRRPLGEDTGRDDLKIASWMTSCWIDAFGLDSEHDYDPLWARAVALGMPLAAHSSGMGFSDRQSITNYLNNQIGHFAASGGALAKSLFLGGVTHRFPDLRIAVLEGGCHMGVEILVALVSTWGKRNPAVIGRLDPKSTDRGRYDEILAAYAPELSARYSADELIPRGRDSVHDDFELTGVTSEQDIIDQFTRTFTWGVEGDDPLVGLAFDDRVLPRGARIRCLMGSDIGHWDVPRFDEPLEEAYELLEKGILDASQLRDFLFAYPARYLTDANPDFFVGTAIEAEVKAELDA
jgi:predicted TIM-barrel fold metal-dependent hydrolase